MRRNGSKYNATRTELDGYQFASKAEAKRYAELKMLEKAGLIHGLQMQPRFTLLVVDECSDKTEQEIGHYVADFRYMRKTPTGTELVVEDVKGFKTPLYRWKKKHVEAQYGISITEIT